MPHLNDTLATLKRPRLLVKAARRAAESARRQSQRASSPALLEEETRLEAFRRAGDVTYSAQRHIRVLAALLQSADSIHDVAA